MRNISLSTQLFLLNLSLLIIPRSNEHVKCTVKDTVTANSFCMTANELVRCFGKSEVLIEMQSLKNFQIISVLPDLTLPRCFLCTIRSACQSRLAKDDSIRYYPPLLSEAYAVHSCSNLYVSDYTYLYFFGIFVLLNKEHQTTCRYKKKTKKKNIPTYQQTFKNKKASNNPLPYATIFEAGFTGNAGISVNDTSKKETPKPL